MVAAAAAEAEAAARSEEEKERKETPVDLEALQVWEDAFKKFDYDNSGSIDKGELKKAMKALGRSITDAEAVSMMEEADADKSGEIDFMEFRKLVARKSKSKLWYDAATKAGMDAAIKLQQVRATPVDRLAELRCALHLITTCCVLFRVAGTFDHERRKALERRRNRAVSAG